jgi:hypothetical protein
MSETPGVNATLFAAVLSALVDEYGSRELENADLNALILHIGNAERIYRARPEIEDKGGRGE